MRVRFAGLVLALCLVPATARGDVRPNALCSDGMVLQQKAEVCIWGTAEPGEKVSVTFRGQTVSETADQGGGWLVMLKSGEPGGPHEMTIAGKNMLQYKNVLVGEVWVCSGQSNMEWPIEKCGGTDKERAVSAAPNPQLRMFTVARTTPTTPQKNTSGTWAEANPSTVLKFSAVGYYFGKDLQADLKVPIGLIHTSWGGTRAEAWTSKEALDAQTLYKGEHERFSKALEAYKALPKPEPKKNPLNANSPSVLYNGMVAPLLNYTIRGVIWYQGESNAGQGYNYRTLFPLMIETWRKDFRQKNDFPFYFVQLAPFTAIPKAPGKSNWAELRESQQVTLKLPNTGMAVITDLGSEHDIHPTPKQPVGERLARIARANVYGEKIEYSGPTLRNAQFEGDHATLTFDHAEGGLVAKELVATNQRKLSDGRVLAAWRVNEKSSGNDEVTGFTVAGKDEKFYPAKATISGNTVTVSSPDVKEPIAVRYGWADHPLANLSNREGLPASPFRTDRFPLATQPKE